ncbi:MAG: hypothetical protein KGZ58_09515 [Ignavibacteriales bacterium]|nr:hypothetical protein [Ignavibacteriales bacterium]
MQFSSYSITAPTSLKGSVDAESFPLIMGKQNVLKNKNGKERFGIFGKENAKAGSSATLFEILDASSNEVVKKISLDDYFGKENDNWKLLRTEKLSNDKVRNIFQAKNGNTSFTLICDVEIKTDSHLPTGKSLSLSLSVEFASARIVKTKFYGAVKGLFGTKENAVWIMSNDSSSKVNPAIVCSVIRASSIENDARRKTFVATTDDVQVEAGETTTIFSLIVTGTSVEFQEHTQKQTENLVQYFTSKKVLPEIIAVTKANKLSTISGDTILYSIVYHNIGTDGATDVNLNNSIPNGTVYIDESAGGNGSSLTVTRETLSDATNRVSSITWNYKDAIMPGDERIAFFKVRVL